MKNNNLNAQEYHEYYNELLTRKEVAAFFKVRVETISAWGKKGILKPHRIGNKVFYWKSEIIQAIKPIFDNSLNNSDD